MKGMPLPFDFEGKGVLLEGILSNNPNQFLQNKWKHQVSFLGTEPTSVLDNISSPTSTTLSSSFPGGGGTDTAGLAVSGNHQPSLLQSLEIGTGGKCGLGLEDFESLLPNFMVAQDQSMLKWIIGDVEDPSNGGFDCVNQLPGFNPIALFAHDNGDFISTANPNPPILLSNQVPFEDVKSQIYNLNQFQHQQVQNPGLFLPVGSTQEEEQQLILPQPKRHNYGDREPDFRFLDSGQQLEMLPHQHQFLSALQQKPVNEFGYHNLVDQIYEVAESVQTGNLILAQEILARLNHQLSAPIGKPLYRAAFYFKEALQLLLHHNITNNNSMSSTLTHIFKIAAYKSFSEISPVTHFANFTCNQALLEAVDEYNHIHIVDFGFEFGFGLGEQWASLMQELALRNVGPPSLKITAFTSGSMMEQLELGLTRENLIQLASEINMPLEFEIMGIDVILTNPSSLSFLFRSSNIDAIAVNLPSGSYFALPSVLRFIKLISPKIVVSLDRGSDRTDLPFPNHLTHALQTHANLLESLDAANVNADALQKIERFVIQPVIEKVVIGRSRCLDKTQHWRTAFLSAGFSPLIFSNFNESQAECVVKRTHVRGFHVEKRLGSLVLCWQRKELVSASAWRC